MPHCVSGVEKANCQRHHGQKMVRSGTDNHLSRFLNNLRAAAETTEPGWTEGFPLTRGLKGSPAKWILIPGLLWTSVTHSYRWQSPSFSPRCARVWGPCFPEYSLFTLPSISHLWDTSVWHTGRGMVLYIYPFYPAFPCSDFVGLFLLGMTSFLLSSLVMFPGLRMLPIYVTMKWAWIPDLEACHPI